MTVNTNQNKTGITLLRPTPYTYIPLGDSRVANGSGGTAIDQARAPHNHLQALLGGRLNQIRNAGVSGNTSADMLARVQTDVIAYAPGWCLLEGPVNDINNSLTLAQSQANVKAIYQACQGSGIRFATSTISPWNATWTAAQHAQHAAYNCWVKAWCAANGIPCADNYATNASMTTGLPVTNSIFDSNGHYSDYGARLAAAAWYAVLNGVIPMNQFQTSMPFDYDNLVWDGMGGWTVGASLPTTWIAYNNTTGAQTSSVVARTDGVQGSLLQAVATAGAQGQYLGFQRATLDRIATAWLNATSYAVGYRIVANDGNQYVCTTAGTSGGSQPVWNSQVGSTTTDNTVTWTRYNNFAVGDNCYAEAELIISSISGGGINPSFIAQCQGTSGDARFLIPTDQATKVPVYSAGTYILRTRNFTLPVGNTGWIPYVYAYLDNGAQATIQVGRIAIKHVVTV